MTVAGKISLLSLALPFILQGCFGGNCPECTCSSELNGGKVRCVELSTRTNGTACINAMVKCGATTAYITATAYSDEQKNITNCLGDQQYDKYSCPWGGNSNAFDWNELLQKGFVQERENVFCYEPPTDERCPNCKCFLQCSKKHREETSIKTCRKNCEKGKEGYLNTGTQTEFEKAYTRGINKILQKRIDEIRMAEIEAERQKNITTRASEEKGILGQVGDLMETVVEETVDQVEIITRGSGRRQL